MVTGLRHAIFVLRFEQIDRIFLGQPQYAGGRVLGERFDGRNDAGQFVGWADTRKHGQQAFVFVDGQLNNLNSMVDVGKKTLQWANAINNNGDITGFMRIPRPISESHGFLLRPIDQ